MKHLFFSWCRWTLAFIISILTNIREHGMECHTRSILKILEAQQMEKKKEEKIKLRQPKLSYCLKQSGYVECISVFGKE